MIFGIGLEMLSQLRNPVGQQRDLNVSAAGVLLVSLVSGNDVCFLLSR